MALWNKVISIDSFEEYTCPCGFELNSQTNLSGGLSPNINAGNLVADHLMNCEYKFCYFKSSNQDKEKEDEPEVEEEEENDGNADDDDDEIETVRQINREGTFFSKIFKIKIRLYGM